MNDDEQMLRFQAFFWLYEASKLRKQSEHAMEQAEKFMNDYRKTYNEEVHQ